MKFFLAVVTVALVAQVCLVQANKSPFQLLKETIPLAIDKYETVYKEIPDTEAFKTYRHDILELINFYKTKNTDMLCFEKLMKCLSDIKSYYEKLEENKSKEAQEILELFAKHKDEKIFDELSHEMEHPGEPTESEAKEVC